MTSYWVWVTFKLIKCVPLLICIVCVQLLGVQKVPIIQSSKVSALLGVLMY